MELFNIFYSLCTFPQENEGQPKTKTSTSGIFSFHNYK